ncbi:MAG TPA: hypothetical protein VGQ37_01020 [Vicinamibacterales bacterium]|jgi:hypothetical protein|nr:hypothetical protein [Vicinamibacterales bacterium]
MRRGSVAALAALLAVVAVLWFQGRSLRSSEPPPAPVATTLGPNRPPAPRIVTGEARLDAIARAQVWREPARGAGQSLLPASAVIDALSCRFVLKHLSGTTPKFNCILQTGEEVRIKYGKAAEIPAEAAATRLLRALGFGADEIALVHHLRCYGCPLEPFVTSKAVQSVRAGTVYEKVLDYDSVHDYEWVALERKYHAWPIETATQEGWAFPELDRVDASRGGAPRAQVDALRLAAVFLAHWDNKADNQRLVCDRREWPEGTPCAAPLMMLQDLGATFGPRKVSLRRWRTSTIWSDRPRCRITMRHLPYSGATFADVEIGEAGRLLAARLLGRLTDEDIADLFRSARFDQTRGLFSDVRPVAGWVEAFKTRVRLISEGPPCPPV